jgi:hypothetical protein
MRSRIAIILIILMMLPTFALAQDEGAVDDSQSVEVVDIEQAIEAEEAGPQHAITINPVAIFVSGFLGFEYEQAMTSWVSIFVAPWIDVGTGVNAAEDETVMTFGADLGARFFPMSGAAPKGFFVGPQMGFGYTSIESGTVEASGIVYYIGAMLGYTWLIADMVDLSLGLGMAYFDYEVTAEESETGLGVSMGFALPFPIARLAVGYAW